MSFMEPEIYFGQYYAVEANHGETHIVPVQVGGFVRTYGELADYVEGTIDNPDDTAVVLNGWLGRLSAPGYMDCTDWSVYDSEAEAIADLTEDDFDHDEPSDDDEPSDEDIYTSDHRRFYYLRKLIVEVGEDDDWMAAVGAWCKANGYFPNVWFESDHGNMVLISVSEDGRYLNGHSE